MKTIICAVATIVYFAEILFAQTTASAVIPAMHAHNVSSSTTIQVTFSDTMLASSFNDTISFIVSGTMSGRHRGTIVLSSGNTIATFTPTTVFAKGEIVTVHITSNLQDTDSAAMTPFVYSFTVNVERASGTFAPKIDYTVSTEVYNAKDVLIYDVDNDGDGDLVVSNDSISIVKNNGDGAFTENANYASGATPYAISIGDLDGDGDGDIAAVISPNILAILKNNGNGTFAGKVEYTTSTSPTSLFIGDIDGDGDGDIAVGCSISGVLSILMNNGDGTFAPRIDYLNVSSGYDLFISDLDGDGDGDIAATSGVSNTVAIMKNNGDGTFAAKSEYAVGLDPFSFFVSDLDSDGDGDIAVSNHFSNTVSILKNNGDGSFAAKVDYEIGTGTAPQSVTITDLDGDGDGDIVVGCDSINTVYVLKNNGDGIFAAKAGYTIGSYTLSIAVGDVNGDGISDIAAANFPESTVSILLGRTGPSVTTNDASNISVSTTTVNGTVNANNASTTVRFLYGTVLGTYTDSITAVQSPVSGTTSTPVTGSLSGLSPSTTYYFRVAGNNADGYVRGGESNFTTTSSASPTATTNNASNIGVATARANGTVNAGNASTIIRFLYGTVSGTYTDSVTATQSPVSGTTSTSVTGSLSTLDSNTTYYFLVAANNAIGYVRGTELSFTTDSTGSSGYALQFDGNDYVAASLVTTVTDNLTLEEWVKWDGGNAVNQLLIFNGHSGNNGYGIIVNPDTFFDNTLGILCGGVAYMHSTTTVTTNVWHHVAAVRDGGIWKLYLDGVQLALNNSSVVPRTPDITGTKMGQNTFKGTLDEIRVWNVARTESEIQTTMNQSLNGAETGLVAYWNFDEGTGPTTADITGNGNDGTVNGATWVSSITALPAGPSATTNNASNIGVGTARANGIVYANNASTTVRFLVGTVSGTYTDSVTATQSPVTGTSNTSVSKALTDLTANTTYYFRVAAENVNGYVRGNEMSFTTNNTGSLSGYALEFDGVNDYVDMGNSSTLDAGSGLTYEAWINPYASHNGWIISKLVPFIEHQALTLAGNRINFYLHNAFSGAQFSSSSIIPFAQFTHVAVTYNGATAKIYINGVLDTSKSVNNAITNGSGDLYIGENPSVTGSSNPFHGMIDEVRVWNVARTESEIQSAMNLSLNGNETGLVAYWNFDEGVGSTTADISSNGNDGAISGAAWVTSAVALPVELTSFSASAKQNGIELKWKTATEVNNYGFEIQRRAAENRSLQVNGSLEWQKIGFVEGKGTTNSPKEYSYSDKNLSSGKYLYRLKQIDRDGKFAYSQEVDMNVGEVPNVFTLEQNYPNPFNPATTIGFTLQESGFTSLKIYDAIGREVATLVNEVKEAGRYSATFDASNLASGVYFAKLQNGSNRQLKRMLLMK